MAEIWRSGPTLGSIRPLVRIDQEIIQSSWNLVWTFFIMCLSFCENFMAFGLVELELWSIQVEDFRVLRPMDSFESNWFESIRSNPGFCTLRRWRGARASGQFLFFLRVLLGRTLGFSCGGFEMFGFEGGNGFEARCVRIGHGPYLLIDLKSFKPYGFECQA